VTSIALSPDSRRIVSASLDDTVCVWDAQTGQPIGSPVKGDIRGVISLAFSPDGCQFAAASSDSTICLWNMESQKLIGSYHKDCINKMSLISFSSDGRQLMTSSIDGTIHTWNATSGKPINAPKSSSMSPLVNSKPLAFSKEHGWCHEESDEALLRWYPVDNPDFGHWTYIDGKLIRRDKTGLTTIMDMSEV
jgi:WD40 repeat protein